MNILSKSQDLHVAGGTTFHLPCKVREVEPEHDDADDADDADNLDFEDC